jgi:ABC-2 type transport system permease protein
LFKNVFLKTLRDHMWAALAWGFMIALIMLFSAGQYPELLAMGTGTPEERLADATRMTKAFAIASGEVVALDSVGGYVTSRALGPEAMVLGLWALMLGVALIRGEEGEGALDVLLSSSVSRLGALAQKLAAGLVIVAATCVLAFFGLWAGYAVARTDMPVLEAALSQVNVLTMVAFWGAIGLLAGQVWTPRRKASAIGGSVLLGTYVLNNVFETNSDLEHLEWYTPWHLFSMSKPLAGGYAMDWAAWSALAGLTTLLLIVATVLFARRDVGVGISLPGRARTQRKAAGDATYMLDSPFTKALRDLLWPSVGYGLGLAAGAALFVGSIEEAMEPLRKMSADADGWIIKMIGTMSTNESFLQSTFFLYLQIFLVIFAVMQVSGWVGDEEEGRMEMQAAMPVPRWQVLVVRYAAMVVAILGMLAIVAGGIFGTAYLANVTLDAWRILGALLATLPMTMLIAAFGICMAMLLRRPGHAMPVMVGLVVAMFFLHTLGPVWDVPETILDLSVFHLYGRPAVDGLEWSSLTALVVCTFLFAGASLVALQRRDIAK